MLKKFFVFSSLATAIATPLISTFQSTNSSLNLDLRLQFQNQTTKREHYDTSQEFLKKIKNNKITKTTNQEFENFKIQDYSNFFFNKITYLNDSLFYKPNTLPNLNEQINLSLANINQKLYDDFMEKTKTHFDGINRFMKIKKMQPYGSRYVALYADGLRPKSDYDSSEAAPPRTYNLVQPSSNYYPTLKTVKTGPSFWQNVKDEEILIRYEIIENNATWWMQWHDFSSNVWYQNTKNKTYNKFEIKFKNNDEIFEFDGLTKNREILLPRLIYTSPNSSEVQFTTGLANLEKIPYSKMQDRTYYTYQRFGLSYNGEVVPEVRINPNNMQMINVNLTDEINIDNETLGWYIKMIPGKLAKLVDQGAYLQEKRDLINQYHYWRNKSSYKNAYEAVKNNIRLNLKNPVTDKETIVNRVNKITQHNFQIPEKFITNVLDFTVSNSAVKYFNQYEGVENLILNKLRLDPQSGVKSKVKPETNVYDVNDIENVNLHFTLDRDFLTVLNSLDNLNKIKLKLIDQPDSDEKQQALKILNSLKINPETIDRFLNDNTDTANIIKTINDHQDTSFTSILLMIKKVLDDDLLVTPEKLMFYHDLPQIIDEYLTYTDIEADVDYGNEQFVKEKLFFNREFKKINVDRSTAVNFLANSSDNVTTIKIKDIKISTNNSYFRLNKNLNPKSLLKNYPINNTFVVTDNMLIYNLNYRNDYADITFKQQGLNAFKITSTVDHKGLKAKNYRDNPDDETNKQNLIVTLQNELNSSDTLPIIWKENVEILGNKSLKKTEYKEALENKLTELGIKPQSFANTFFAVVGIKNSNDLRTMGDKMNSEISPNRMWFIARSETQANLRYYLVKYQALKKPVQQNKIRFDSSLKNKQLQLIVNLDDYEDIINWSFSVDSFNCIKNQQIWKIPENEHYELNVNQLDSNIWTNLESALNKLGLGINNKSSYFDYSTNSFHVTLIKLKNDSDISFDTKTSKPEYAGIIENEKQYYLSYKINDSILDKIAIELKIKKYSSNLTSEVEVLVDKNFNEFSNEIYIKPFREQIEKDITKLLEKKFNHSDWKITGLDFTNEDKNVALTTPAPTTEKFDNQEGKKSFPLVGVIVGLSILLMTAGFVVWIILFKKKNGRWPLFKK